MENGCASSSWPEPAAPFIEDAMEFGWWIKDPEQGKFQVHAVFHGGNIKWLRKQGHFSSWEPHAPTEKDWARLIAEADNRFARRLLSPRQFDTLRQLRQRSEL